MTAEAVLRELWELTDGETPIPAEAVARMAEERGIALQKCVDCGEYDYHESECPEALCRMCERPTCDGNCGDRAYERVMGK